MYGIGDGIAEMFKLGAALLAISIPLSIWKLIDIVLWLVGHVSILWS